MDDPFRQFGAWWAGQRVPMVLATDGPAARAVVLELFDERGFCFWTSSESPTGRQLAALPRAALVWLWPRVAGGDPARGPGVGSSAADASRPARQVRVEGTVERLPDEENERHWREREGKRPLAAFRQSKPVESREELVGLVEAVPEEPERPPWWVGYRVVPERFEFWEEDPDFLHDRFEYRRDGGGWTMRRLQP